MNPAAAFWGIYPCFRFTHLPDHAVPGPSHQLAVFSVGDQVEVVGELDGAGQFLQDVYAEALTAQFGVGLRVSDNTAGKDEKEKSHSVFSCLAAAA